MNGAQKGLFTFCYELFTIFQIIYNCYKLKEWKSTVSAKLPYPLYLVVTLEKLNFISFDTMLFSEVCNHGKYDTETCIFTRNKLDGETVLTISGTFDKITVPQQIFFGAKSDI